MAAPMKQEEIDEATADDIDRIQSLYNHERLKQELHWFTYREALERAVERDDRTIFYRSDPDDEQVLGASMVWCESRVLSEDEAQIRLIAVHPDYRNQNLGRTLVDHSEDFARQFDKHRLIAEASADSPALSFWSAVGFSKQRKRTTDGGREMVILEKQL